MCAEKLLDLGNIFYPRIFLSPRNVTVQNFTTISLDKILSPKFWQSPRNVKVQNVTTIYPDKILSPKFWLSPRNVTTYFVWQMNRPMVFFAKDGKFLIRKMPKGSHSSYILRLQKLSKTYQKQFFW